MTTLAVAFAEIALLKARLDALEAGGGGSSGGSTQTGGGVPRVEPLPDHLLDNAWADEKITRDPKGWKGATQLNRTLSRAPADWLAKAASNLEYKAQKEREAVPVALQTQGRNAGKPWHEATTFKARLMRAWENRARSRAAAAPPPPKPPPQDPGGGDDFNFGANAKGPAEAPPDEDIGF